MNTAVLASSEAKTIPRSKDLALVGPKTGEGDLKDSTPGQSIFYRAFIIVGEDVIYQEFGVGYVHIVGNNPQLKRERILHSYSERSGEGDSKKPKRLKSPSGSRIFVQTGTPDNYKDMFVHPNSVLCCSTPGSPLSVELQDNTLLGRFEDTIQSIDKNELWTILTNYTDEQVLPAAGSIRFNPVDGVFEGYDGTRWRSLMWGEK